MYNQQQPQPMYYQQQPPAKRPRPLLFLGLVLVVVLTLSGIIGAIFGGDDATEQPTVCDLLRDGWTVGQLANNDAWKDWPASQSQMSRGAEIVDAAEDGGCDLLAAR